VREGRTFAYRSRSHRNETITLDGYAASHRAVREIIADALLPEGTHVRSSFISFRKTSNQCLVT
jgi:hypothetical protein